MNSSAVDTIVQVSSMDLGGGAERIASDLHRSFKQRGYASYLAVGQRFDPSGDSILIPNDENRSAWARAILALAPPVPGPHRAPSKPIRAIRAALKVVAEPVRSVRRAVGYEDFDFPGTALIPRIAGTTADIIHLHNLHGGYFDLRQLPYLSASAPTVLTAHDTWVTSGHCAYTLDCGQWRCGCGACPYLHITPAILGDKSAQNVQLKKKIYRQSSVHLVGPSRWVLETIENSIFAEAIASSTLIPNGVDQTIFRRGDQREARNALGLPLEPLILLFSVASETNPYKDFAAVRAALPKIVAMSEGREVLLLALGRYPSVAADVGAPIISIPYLENPQDVARYLQAADVCIHMAHAENHPLAILEAQSCGLPVVASRVGGIPEALSDGYTGLLVPASDSRALAEAVSALLIDDERRKQMGRAAADWAQGRFDLERMVDQYAELYDSAASAKPS